MWMLLLLERQGELCRSWIWLQTLEQFMQQAIPLVMLSLELNKLVEVVPTTVSFSSLNWVATTNGHGPRVPPVVHIKQLVQST